MRAAKEQFVGSNILGGSPYEVVGIFIGVAVLTSAGGGGGWRDVLFVVFPLCMLCTVWADAFAWIACMALGVALLLTWGQHRDDKDNVGTVYRGSMMLFTCICILAVDFPIFPRRFGKTEEFGFSLMDAGVGMFVFSSGMFARRASGSWKVIVLGVVRFAVTWALDYHQHITEYGVHWNFFVTLGIVHSVCVGLLRAPQRTPLAMGALAMLLSFAYQVALGMNEQSLTQFILHAPRTSFFHQNREGMLSCVGFAAIFLFGISLRSWLWSPGPLLGVIFFFGGTTAITHLLWQNASRRMANLAYICFIVSGNSVVLLVLQLLQVKAGPVLRAISKNQLAVFLVAPRP